MGLSERVRAVAAWIAHLKPVRVLSHFSRTRGPILASGMAYQSLFAVFAALWVAFSIAGTVVSSDSRLQGSIIAALNDAVPGLIDTGSGGAIDPEVLTSGWSFSITGVIALAGLLYTALGWLAAARDSVRTIFDLPPAATHPLLQKALDLALGGAFAALLLVAAGLSFAGSSATQLVLDQLAVGQGSVIATILSRIVSLATALLVYAVALAGLYRLVARVRVPWRLLRGGILIGALGIASLTILGGALVGGATANPLIASFAVVAGLLIYYNLVSQLILLAAAWMAVGATDAGLRLNEEAAEEDTETPGSEVGGRR